MGERGEEGVAADPVTEIAESLARLASAGEARLSGLLAAHPQLSIELVVRDTLGDLVSASLAASCLLSRRRPHSMKAMLVASTASPNGVQLKKLSGGDAFCAQGVVDDHVGRGCD